MRFSKVQKKNMIGKWEMLAVESSASVEADPSLPKKALHSSARQATAQMHLCHLSLQLCNLVLQKHASIAACAFLGPVFMLGARFYAR